MAAARGSSGLPPSRTASQRSEHPRRQNTGPIEPAEAEPQYVVYVRLPFLRNGFVDPPQVDWNATKERALWKLLSNRNRDADIDWDDLAKQLNVSRAFILQQAAWLYERELSNIQAQMRKAGGGMNTSFPGPSSPVPNSPIAGGFPAPKAANTGADGRVPSALAIRSTATPTPRPSSVASPIGSAPRASTPMSRTASGSGAARPAPPPTEHRFSHPTVAEAGSPERRPSSSSVSEDSMDATSSSDEDEASGDNGILRKLPAFLKKTHNSSSEDDGGDEEPAFLPFSSGGDGGSAGTGTVTLSAPRRVAPSGRRPKDLLREGSDLAGAPAPRSPRVEPLKRSSRPLGSPRRIADSAGPSSPSMGSSFSDLSDASVSQSAMEEAYLSTMQAGGGMASRMSTLSQAVRSRYLGNN